MNLFPHTVSHNILTASACVMCIILLQVCCSCFIHHFPLNDCKNLPSGLLAASLYLLCSTQTWHFSTSNPFFFPRCPTLAVGPWSCSMDSQPWPLSHLWNGSNSCTYLTGLMWRLTENQSKLHSTMPSLSQELCECWLSLLKSAFVLSWV